MRGSTVEREHDAGELGGGGKVRAVESLQRARAGGGQRSTTAPISRRRRRLRRPRNGAILRINQRDDWLDEAQSR